MEGIFASQYKILDYLKNFLLNLWQKHQKSLAKTVNRLQKWVILYLDKAIPEEEGLVFS